MIDAAYLSTANNWLLLTTLVYFLMNGAQIFETAVLIPKWTSAPPASIAVLQGPFAPDLKTFWIAMHSVHELTFIAAIGFCWKIDTIRYALLTLFALHFAVRVWTIAYFAPRIMAFQAMDLTRAEGVEKQVISWRRLNYIRAGLFILIGMAVAVTYTQLRRQSTQNFSIKHHTMEQRLSVLTLGVDDLQKQKEFYQEKLGWRVAADNDDIVFFKLNGFLFSLFDRSKLAAGSGLTGEGNGFRSMVMSYNVPEKQEVDEMYLLLKDKGIQILKQPEATPFGGYYFTFADTEHNVLEVAYNPYIPLDHNGNVIDHKSIKGL